MSRKQQLFWEDRFKKLPGIRAVGRRDRTVQINRQQYAEAATVFRELVKDDFPARADRHSVLDVGYGLGHYAKLCHKFGFASYTGVDFAAPPLPAIDENYHGLKVDFGRTVDLQTKFDLVIAIDVIYHVVDPEEFETFLDNMRKHARRRIYVTGLFREMLPTQKMTHCWHRPIEEFARLGRLIDVRPWRDNQIARFSVE